MEFLTHVGTCEEILYPMERRREKIATKIAYLKVLEFHRMKKTEKDKAGVHRRQRRDKLSRDKIIFCNDNLYLRLRQRMIWCYIWS